MDEPVRTRREGAIAVVELARPQALNALDLPTVAALRRAIEQVRDDGTARCLLLLAEGKYFMAGGDVQFMQDALAAPEPERRRQVRQLIDDAHAAIRALMALPCPVVAAVQGGAAGYGVSLVAACDFVLAGEKSAWSMAYTNLGVTPDGGATWFLPRLMGARRARELILLSERFDGATALRLDLVNRLVPDGELRAEAKALAERLAAGPTRAYANARRLLAQSFDNPLDVQLEQEAASFAQCADTQDFAEGVAAFTGRRRPDFSGR